MNKRSGSTTKYISDVVRVHCMRSCHGVLAYLKRVQPLPTRAFTTTSKNNSALISVPAIALPFASSRSLNFSLPPRGAVCFLASMSSAHYVPLRMMVDVCSGISHIHSHGLIHSDLKFGNILVHEVAYKRFVAKVTDFGFAQGERVPYRNPPYGDLLYCRVWFDQVNRYRS